MMFTGSYEKRREMMILHVKILKDEEIRPILLGNLGAGLGYSPKERVWKSAWRTPRMQ